MPNKPAEAGTRTVQLENIQTLRTIDATKALLEEQLDAASDITLDCSRIDEADLSFIQVVLSARKSAEWLGAGLRLVGVPAEVRAVVERCGAAEDPFWNGETP